jgi:hypothetical protein
MCSSTWQYTNVRRCVSTPVGRTRLLTSNLHWDCQPITKTPLLCASNPQPNPCTHPSPSFGARLVLDRTDCHGLVKWPQCSMHLPAYSTQPPPSRGRQTSYDQDLHCSRDVVWHGGVAPTHPGRETGSGTPGRCTGGCTPRIARHSLVAPYVLFLSQL